VTTGEPSPEVLRILREALRQAQALTTSWGSQLYFVYVPSWSRYRNGPTVADRERAAVFDVVNSLKIPIVDVQPAIDAHNDALSLFPFRRFGHYNKEGNKVIADVLLTVLAAHAGDVKQGS
jgi:hypothetical protein